MSNGSGGQQRPSVVVTALVLALACGAVDAATALLDKPSGFASLLAILPPLFATAVTVFVLFLLAWGTLSRLVPRVRLEEAPAATAIAVLIASGFALATFSDLFRSALNPINLFRWILVAAVSFLIAAVSYMAILAIDRSPSVARYAVGLARGAPIILLIVVFFEWFQIYVSKGPTSIASLASVAFLVVALSLGMRWFTNATRAHAARALWGLAFTLAFVSVVAASFDKKLPSTGAQPSTARHKTRHVILISVDTLRADRLSCYDGEHGVPTPGIDSLAADGVLFEKPTSSAPWTLASLASILTGLSPSVHSVIDIDSRLPDSVSTLAELMQRAGYRTGAVVLNDLLHPRANLAQGFDDYYFLTFPAYGRSFGRRVLERVLPSHFHEPAWPTTDDVTNSALAWLDANHESDFFFWIHYYDPHAPFEPPARYLPETDPPPGMGRVFADQKAVLSGLQIPSRAARTWIQALYSAEVKYLDDNVGRLIETLKRLGVYEDALIVFTSDHGEEFWEHGAHGHGHSLYNELLSVPLIIKLPGSMEKGRVEARVATESITPTVLELCELDFDARRFSSGSLVRFLEPGTGAEKPPASIVSTAQVLFDRQETVYFGGLKYIRSMIGDDEKLFDLESDPLERSSLLHQDNDAVSRARAMLEEHEESSRLLREHFDIAGVENVEFDDETLEKLKALGYIP